MKFDFGDLYKFVVSAGLALVGMSILSVWLIFKEPFDLNVKESDLLLLTPVAQEVIKYRQHVVGLLVAFSMWAIPITAFAGFCLSVWGLQKWKQQQSIVDELAELGLEEKKVAIRPKTDDEIALSDQSEGVICDVQVARSANARLQRPSYIDKALVKKLHYYLPVEYKVDPNMLISGAEVDFVLTSSHWLHKDYLIEVKYIRKGFNLGWLSQVALKLRTASVLYSNVTNRIPNTCLLIVVADSAWNAEKYADLKDRFFSAYPKRAAKHRISIMSESRFEGITSEAMSLEMGLPIKNANT
ncbi:hypothetical protein D3C81_752790 [compost metagenome]|uniref:Uncharacterized protein n=1 Tax=Pseudomonas wadenswilerensis TaxID=1785161 RepID=A0A380SUB2_9PSED|nr:hypothetical protein [Pseudomonas wadenswilerensis]SUQ61567.1 hypothetical protein CCOS864_00991 [Pseudomonas wadenswilerensis]